MKIINSIVLVMMTAVCCSNVRAQKEAPKNIETTLITRTDVKSLMYQVLSDLSELQPYMVSEKKFLDPANEKDLQERFNKLASLSDKVMRQKKLQVTSYRISGEALNEHFKELKYTFKSGNKKYARWMLSATPFACASCHTQLPNSPKPLWQVEAAQLAGTPIEKADFLFAIRNYDEAEKLYTDLIRNYPGAALPNFALEAAQVDNALKRKLTIFVKVRRDFAGAKSSFEKDLLNKNLSKDARENMAEWLKQLLKVAKRNSKIAKDSTKVLKYAQSVLEELPRGFVVANYPKLVEILYVSGLLYETLHEQKRSDQTPSILYWLGVSDLALNNEFFFSLGPVYLRECILQFSTSPVAKKCFAEFEFDVKNQFTGTRGTEIPEDVLQDLKFLKSKVGLAE